MGGAMAARTNGTGPGAESMSAVATFLDKVRHREEVRERQRKQLGRQIFQYWCGKYAIALARYLRLLDEVERMKAPQVVHGPSKQWCCAAYTILCFGSEVLRDAFLRANDRRKQMIIDAALRDGGVEDDRGRFKEILP